MARILYSFFCLYVLVAFTSVSFAAQETTADTKEQTRSVAPEALYAGLLVSAEKGDVQAMLALGSLYEQGIGTARNFTSALQIYEKAAFAGSADGYFRQGICYEVGMGAAVDIGKAVASYKKAAELGLPQAQHKMSSLYFAGRGLPKDEKQGFALLSQAAQTGDAQAANELAYVYLKGLFGQKENAAAAREWFGKSAEKGHMEAMKNLAVMLKDGIGGKANLEAALRWYLIAQKGGLQAGDLQKTIDDVKGRLQKAQIKKAEQEANAWLTVFTAKNETKPR